MRKGQEPCCTVQNQNQCDATYLCEPVTEMGMISCDEKKLRGSNFAGVGSPPGAATAAAATASTASITSKQTTQLLVSRLKSAHNNNGVKRQRSSCSDLTQGQEEVGSHRSATATMSGVDAEQRLDAVPSDDVDDEVRALIICFGNSRDGEVV